MCMHAVFYSFLGLQNGLHGENSRFGDFSTIRVCLCVLNKDVYIKIVVIVNDHFFVDKSVYRLKIIDLAHKKVGAQALYLRRTCLG